MHVDTFHVYRKGYSELSLACKWLNVLESDPSQSWADGLEAQIPHTHSYFLLDLKFFFLQGRDVHRVW